VEHLRTGLVEPLIALGHQVALTLTPTAAGWFAPDELEDLAELTGLPVRSVPRMPGEPRPHPPIDLFIAAPLSANSVAKLALGIGDNQALTVLSEALGTTPMIVFPRVNAAHVRHPAWAGHVATLRRAGAELIEGPEVWPLAEPRAANGGQVLPWDAIIERVRSIHGS
jgi:hypothetical protein